ncbi:hypothetical protein [Vreelandella azerica]|uniref:hypothetical protein n=1 Tax=Vreelandella azerica TaxID=2732867 RepID=UPI002E2D1402|nr:hypothetical protein [Halomonas azerica]
MSVRRFVGTNSRDVMRQVREALGDDALIVANRRTEGGSRFWPWPTRRQITLTPRLRTRLPLSHL